MDPGPEFRLCENFHWAVGKRDGRYSVTGASSAETIFRHSWFDGALGGNPAAYAHFVRTGEIANGGARVFSSGAPRA